jgi:hypothetical protein
VTMQYRKGGGWVYALDSEGVQLDVHISACVSGSGASEWRVSAHQGRSANSLVLTEHGATRAEAFDNLARSWETKKRELSLPTFDWSGTAQALQAVRAI